MGTEGREAEERGGGRAGSGAKSGSSVHFHRPFAKDSTGNLQNKSELSSPPDGARSEQSSRLAKRPVLRGGSLS